MWVLLAVLSALCLGCYDVSKKRSLADNGVVDILACSLLISCSLLAMMLLFSRTTIDHGLAPMEQWHLLYVPRVNLQTHGLIFLKSCLVLSSWVCSYLAIKHLPLSVVSPMQATRPMWTLLGAVTIFGEILNMWQWLGVACALGSIFVFALTNRHSAGTTEIDRRYYLCLVIAILLGSLSGLYDKYMMRHINHNAVQVYYTFYQTMLMSIVWLLVRRRSNKAHTVFHWHWEIATISIFLILSDYVYLLALTYPESLIAVVSTIRRSGVIIPFLYGLIYLHEPNPRKKIACLCGILLGLAFLLLGSLHT